MSLHKLTFVLGGAASGKSAMAERIVDATEKPKVYLATAQAFDLEMKEKIAAHQAMRGAGWTTIEEPFDIQTKISERDSKDILLVDCLTLWLTNILLAEHDLDAEFDRLVTALEDPPCEIVLVSNEVGHGIVPDNALSRQFRAAQGRLNQRIAHRCQTVVAVMAGLPLALKGRLTV